MNNDKITKEIKIELNKTIFFLEILVEKKIISSNKKNIKKIKILITISI
tara:strand:- start:251 stop:397 length:147 start_codon:yes stop_codon:yes gene_type:complete